MSNIVDFPDPNGISALIRPQDPPETIYGALIETDRRLRKALAAMYRAQAALERANQVLATFGQPAEID